MEASFEQKHPLFISSGTAQSSDFEESVILLSQHGDSKMTHDKGDGFELEVQPANSKESPFGLDSFVSWLGGWSLSFFFFETCTILDLGPHLWRVSCHLFIHSLSPLYYSHYIPRFLCCWGHLGQEKNTGFDEQLPWNNFFPGEGCDEDWPDVLDILWQRTSGWEAWRLFVTADFCSKKKGIFQRLIDFQSDKFLGTCRKWEWKWHRFDIFSLACACQAQLTSFHKLLWLFVYMHWYFDSWEA